MFLLVAYDVPAERTEKYRRLLARYLPAMQFSVFAGDLTDTVYRKFRREINEVYEPVDRLIFIQSANRRNIRVEVIKAGVSSEETAHMGSGVV